MRYFTAFVIAIVLAATFSAHAQVAAPGYQDLVKDAKTRIKEIDVERLKAMQSSGEKFTLVDVREDSEWAAGHAQGAVHVGRGVLERDIASAVKEKGEMIVLYCAGGARSALAADTLTKMGYSRVVSLAGGFNAYKAANLPIEK